MHFIRCRVDPARLAAPLTEGIALAEGGLLHTDTVGGIAQLLEEHQGVWRGDVGETVDQRIDSVVADAAHEA